MRLVSAPATDYVWGGGGHKITVIETQRRDHAALHGQEGRRNSKKSLAILNVGFRSLLICRWVKENKQSRRTCLIYDMLKPFHELRDLDHENA